MANAALDATKEMGTLLTNGVGFTRMVGEAYRYFAECGGGHIAVISSIAGTKGLGAAPAYSGTKAFQNVYVQALEQQAHMRHLPIRLPTSVQALCAPICWAMVSPIPC